MKKLSAVLFALTSLYATQTLATEGCPMPSDEKLVCAVVVCDFGLLKGENSSECKAYKKQFAIYLASLGIWDKPPKCKNRDMACNKTGTAKKAESPPSVCTDPDTLITDPECVKGANINSFSCDDMTGEDQDKCYINLAKANGTCDELSGDAKDECLGILPEEEPAAPIEE